METDKWLEQGIALVVEYAPKIVMAILIWIIGSIIFSRVVKYARKIMERRNYEISLREFLGTLLYWALKILLIIVILGTLGIETTSFAAIIASAGLAVGLALQGSLANFAGGVLILIFKPFKVGDFIEAQGLSGTVKEIGIINTVLNTFGNQQAIIPNGKLSNENIVNYSAESTRRENITAGISYDSDIKKAKAILLDIVSSNDKVLKHPEPAVMVAELADSSVNLSLRYWATNDDFWDCRWYVLEEIKNRFDAEGIEIPYPHQVEIQKQA
ncbi:mechanosensitive ion channel family protein [Galbibacter orientalis]|uniref:Small-conductance mechanosensitive channel n=1 Tax=Galbibacter orientalis DSM 19592 TaxID=926559 RepID=I3C546_9FLAO|nr:mechanosensitive ion channel domain-containing protein [Galbibacter orientalis]EIJ38739.1 small-conductance mechanosensitive channel [Galbibacter orientalis DSM 19592]